eukprot:352835-Chlamydomonas_euryale.AAC.9
MPMQAFVVSLAAGRAPRRGRGRGAVVAAMGVRSLCIMRDYYGSGLGAAAAEIAARLAGGGGGRDGGCGIGCVGDDDDAMQWLPLVRPAALEQMWLQLRAAWEAAGLLPMPSTPGTGSAAGAASAPPAALSLLMQLGRLPSGMELRAALGRGTGGAGDSTRSQHEDADSMAVNNDGDSDSTGALMQLLCGYLVAAGAPSGRCVAAAASAAQTSPVFPALCAALALGQQQRGSGGAQLAAAAAVSALMAGELPPTPPETLLHLGACVAAQAAGAW